MNITITNTGEAITEASSLISCANSLKSILSTLKTARQTLTQVWTSGTEIDSITENIDKCVLEYETKILEAMNKLSTGVIAYCIATEELAASGATNSNKEAYDSPSEWVADNVVTLDGYEAPSTITSLTEVSRGEVDAYMYSKALDMGMTEDQAKIAIAISRSETGHYQKAYGNNMGGMVSHVDANGNYVFQRFDTPEAGIDAYLTLLKDSYFGEGLNTLAEIQPKYCPSGEWLGLTSAVYKNRFVDGVSPMN